MKKNMIILIVVLVIIIGFFQTIIRPNLGRNFHYTFIKSTNLNHEKIDELRLYDKIDSDRIIKKYGQQVEKSRNVVGYTYFELREGIEVATNSSQEIVRVLITNQELETVKGIKIGDTDSEVKSAYGNNYYYRREQGVSIIGYIDKANAISIEFWLSNNKVDLIRLDEASLQ